MSQVLKSQCFEYIALIPLPEVQHSCFGISSKNAFGSLLEMRIWEG